MMGRGGEEVDKKYYYTFATRRCFKIVKIDR